MKVRVCPKCGKHNLEDAWLCIECGETLSLNTLTEVDRPPESPSKVTPRRDPSENLKEIIFYRSDDAFISNRQVIMSGETFRVEHIASVEKLVSDARHLPQDAEGERRPRPEDILSAAGLVARTIRSVTGIGATRYLLRIHLQSRGIYDHVSRSEEAVNAMVTALNKAITQRP